MICPECSEEIKDSVLYCPYCGVKIQLQENKDEKDLKIKELEKKVTNLEYDLNRNNNYFNKLERDNTIIQYRPPKKDNSTSEACGIICVICLIFIFFTGLFPYFIVGGF